jgi:hypothetical protein
VRLCQAGAATQHGVDRAPGRVVQGSQQQRVAFLLLRLLRRRLLLPQPPDAHQQRGNGRLDAVRQ